MRNQKNNPMQNLMTHGKHTLIIYADRVFRRWHSIRPLGVWLSKVGAQNVESLLLGVLVEWHFGFNFKQLLKMNQAIEDQVRYLKKAKEDVEAFGDMIEGVEQIASGFQKIATFLKHVKDNDSRVKMHEERIVELEKLLAESQE